MSANLYSMDTSALVDGMGRYYRPLEFVHFGPCITALIGWLYMEWFANKGMVFFAGYSRLA